MLSTLIQTLFYSVFAAWVLWARRQPSNSQATFDWRTAGWELDVPVVRALFDRIGTRGTLGRLGLIEQLDRAGETLNRVDRPAFFDRFATAGAVEYFYEPFLAAFDPELRKELGVWFTPQEVVHYMVDKIDRTLRSDFNFELGLADPRVTVLDPCAGTGSFLLAVLERIHRTLASRSPDPLVPGEVKQAALQRLFGFELLPAPLVISHLQLGLRLRDLGAPLDSAAEERVRVYLTNSLVGWQDSAAAHATIPIPEFEQEWDAATGVKQRTRILVVIGNPPYNAFAGVSPAQEADLLDEYKQGVVTRNTLDDLYVRFLRVAQLRIARRTGQGIVCLITNSSYLAAPSFKSMRTSLLGSFDRITVDNLNGDRDATRKRTPDGRPDPSIFSTPSNPAGIAEGTAIATYVRLPARSEPRFASVRHRDFWGTEKRPELAAAAENGPAYEQVIPSEDNFYALRPIRASNDYYSWPSVTDLAATDPVYGLHEARGGGLFSFEREPLAERMRVYLNADVPDDTLPPELAPLHRAWFGFDPARVRARLTGRGADAADARPFEERKLRRFLYKPCDLRWAYVEPTRGLWVAPQPQLLRAADHGARFLYVRRTAENARPDPPLLLSRHVGDQHALHKTAYLLPTLTVDEDRRTEGAAVQLTAFDHGADEPTATSNLSAPAREYLRAVGRDPEHLTAADELWLHVMAVAFAPGYFRAFTEAMSQAYPRVPLPADGTVLEQSISLGRRITNLLEPVDAGDPALAGVAALGRPATKDHGPIDPARDLEVTVRWGYRNAQGAIMPAAGSTRRRPRTAQEDAAYAQLAAAVNRDRDEIATLLGDEVMDIELNERVHLAGVPLHVWELQIGGFLVLKKWLSYRTRELLARPLRPEELRSLANIARRLAVVVALRPELDENFATVRSDPWPWPVG